MYRVEGVREPLYFLLSHAMNLKPFLKNKVYLKGKIIREVLSFYSKNYFFFSIPTNAN